MVFNDTFQGKSTGPPQATDKLVYDITTLA